MGANSGQLTLNFRFQPGVAVSGSTNNLFTNNLAIFDGAARIFFNNYTVTTNTGTNGTIRMGFGPGFHAITIVVNGEQQHQWNALEL